MEAVGRSGGSALGAPRCLLALYMNITISDAVSSGAGLKCERATLLALNCQFLTQSSHRTLCAFRCPSPPPSRHSVTTADTDRYRYKNG